MVGCSCQDTTTVDFDEPLVTLDEIRQKCSVLREILIPAAIWEQFKRFEQSPRNAARHASIIVMALLDGNLKKITSPCHRYLLVGDHPKKELSKQYRNDLQEQWMFETDEVERHRKSKSFQGRIVELQIAEWLENQSWQITSLEALGSSADIEGIRPLSYEAIVEVKSIGQRDEEFEEMVKSQASLPAGGIGPIHLSCNYLIFRTYETAVKLGKFNKRRIAMVVVDNLAWSFFQIPLRHGLINWHKPQFFDVGDEWNSFLQAQKKRYPSIDSDLESTIGTLHELWIVVRTNGYVYSTQFHYLFS